MKKLILSLVVLVFSADRQTDAQLANGGKNNYLVANIILNSLFRFIIAIK